MAALCPERGLRNSYNTTRSEVPQSLAERVATNVDSEIKLQPPYPTPKEDAPGHSLVGSVVLGLALGGGAAAAALTVWVGTPVEVRGLCAIGLVALVSVIAAYLPEKQNEPEKKATRQPISQE